MASRVRPPRWRKQPPPRVWKHGLSLFGDLKYPADFKQFDYVNANAPKGGAVRLMAFGTFDNFNHGGRRREGLARRRHRPDLRHPDGGGARRGVDRVRAARRGGQPSGGFFLRHLSAARQRQVARRQAGDRRGRDLLLRRLQEEPSAVFGLLQPRHQGGEDRRARGHLHLRRPRQPRTAADRRPAQRAAEALVGGHRQGRQQARRRRDHARAAARLRRLPAQGIRARPHRRLRARRGLLGQGRQRQHRPR